MLDRGMYARPAAVKCTVRGTTASAAVCEGGPSSVCHPRTTALNCLAEFVSTRQFRATRLGMFLTDHRGLCGPTTVGAGRLP